MSKKLLALFAILVIGTAVGLAARAKDNEDKKDKEQEDAQVVTLDKLPAAAREALTKLAGKAKIEEVTVKDDDDEEENGKEDKGEDDDDDDEVEAYEGTWQVNGVKHEATVTAHGDLLESEEVIEADNMPKAAQKAAKKAFPKGTKFKVEKKTIVLYEVEAEIDGKEKELLIAPTGQRVEIEHEDDEDGKNKDDDER